MEAQGDSTFCAQIWGAEDALSLVILYTYLHQCMYFSF